MGLYIKKVPEREADWQFLDRVRHQVNERIQNRKINQRTWISLNIITKNRQLINKPHHQSWNRRLNNPQNFFSFMVLYSKSYLIKKGDLAIHKGRCFLIYRCKKIFQAGVRLKLLKLHLESEILSLIQMHQKRLIR